MSQEPSILDRLRELALLSRIQTGALTAITPVIGVIFIIAWYAAVGNDSQHSLQIDFTIGSWVILACLIQVFIIGLVMHVFGFVLNEYADLTYDRKSPHSAHKPLVSGSISPNSAFSIVVASGIVIMLYVFLITGLSMWPIMAVSLSLLCATIYDLYSKRWPGMDVFLAAWAVLFTVSGAYSALFWAPSTFVLINDETAVISVIPWQAWAVAVLGGIQVLFNNSVEGGIKDATSDRAVGARTLAVVLNVHWTSETSVIIPWIFKMYSLLVKFVFYGIAGVLLLSFWNLDLIDPSGRTYASVGYFAALAVMAITNCVTLFIIVYNGRRTRAQLFVIYSIHEISTYFLAVILLYPVIGAGFTLLLIITPLVWFMGANRILYNSWLKPRV